MSSAQEPAGLGGAPDKERRDARPSEGRIPWGVLDMARFALEVARPDTKEGGVVRREVDAALHYLERVGAELPRGAQSKASTAVVSRSGGGGGV